MRYFWGLSGVAGGKQKVRVDPLYFTSVVPCGHKEQHQVIIDREAELTKLEVPIGSPMDLFSTLTQPPKGKGERGESPCVTDTGLTLNLDR